MRFAVLFSFIILPGVLVAQNTEPVFSIKDRFASSAGVTSPWANRNRMNERFYGLCYSPALNMLNKYSDFSVAAASHIAAAYHPSSNNDAKNYFMFSFPAFLQFNIGHLATHDFYSAVGIFFGAGYNFSVINSEFDSGTLLITAIRFWILKHSFTLGYSQTRFQIQRTLTHEVSLQLNIGGYLKGVHNNNKISKFVKPFRK